MITQNLKDALIIAIKNKNEIAKDILRVALSDIQLAENRGDITEDNRFKILRKIIANNEETSRLSKGDAVKDRLSIENNILLGFLPKMLSKDEIIAFMTDKTQQIKEFPSDGLAIKFAMTELKSAKLSFDGKLVSGLVMEIRK